MSADRPDERFPKEIRLRRSDDYRRVQRRGQRFRQGHLLVCFLPGPGPRMRIGITVSRKVGGAVVRNRVKRWLREAARREKHRLPDGWDVVLIAHPTASTVGFARLREDVARAFDRVARSARRPRSGPRRRRGPGRRR